MKLAGIPADDAGFSVAPAKLRPALTWLVVKLPAPEVTDMTITVPEGWEPFAATDRYVYVRRQLPRWVETTAREA